MIWGVALYDVSGSDPTSLYRGGEKEGGMEETWKGGIGRKIVTVADRVANSSFGNSRIFGADT